MRFFTNTFEDYISGAHCVPDEQSTKQLIDSYISKILKNCSASFENCFEGLYVGCVGIAYVLYKLSKHPSYLSQKEDLTKHALHYLEVQLSHIPQCNQPKHSFLLGAAGTYAMGFVLYSHVGQQQQADMCLRCFVDQQQNVMPNDPNGADELFVGRAGYLCGIVFINKSLGKTVLGRDLSDPVCRAVIESGRRYAARSRSPCPLMYQYHGTQYLGAAHGLSIILQMLLMFPDFLKSDESILSDVRASVDFLLSTQTANGNFVPAVDEVGCPRSEADELLHWCHGAPGIVYLFARAFLLWRDDRYLTACVRCADLAWTRGLLRKGPGICHGVSGSAYVFLLLFRLTGEEKYLHRATCFARFLTEPTFLQTARVPDSPYSLFEGFAGTVCFLADLLQPSQAHFPFSEVFN